MRYLRCGLASGKGDAITHFFRSGISKFPASSETVSYRSINFTLLSLGIAVSHVSKIILAFGIGAPVCASRTTKRLESRMFSCNGKQADKQQKGIIHKL